MRLISILLAAVLFMVLFSSEALSSADDTTMSRISEKCGNWIVTFDWPALEGYSKSTLHSDSESGNIKTFTDTLTITSTSDSDRIIKITITKYSSIDDSLMNSSSLTAMAKQALSKSGVCGNSTENIEAIGGMPGVLVSGAKCPGGTNVYVAAFPIDYFFDRPGRAILSNTIAVIASTWGSETTKRLMNSIRIER